MPPPFALCAKCDDGALDLVGLDRVDRPYILRQIRATALPPGPQLSAVIGRADTPSERSPLGGAICTACVSSADWDKNRDPQMASRVVKEYLATLDDAAFGAASDVTPKFISLSDSAAQWTGAMRGPTSFAYADNYLIDVKMMSKPPAPSVRA